VDVQSTHETPSSPQAESSRPTLQLPDVSQHPPHVAAQPVTLLSSPSPPALASSPAVVPSSPVSTLPPLAAPLLLRPTPLPLPELPLEPPDDDVLASAFFTGGVDGLVSTLSSAVDPVAHAATVARATARLTRPTRSPAGPA